MNLPTLIVGAIVAILVIGCLVYEIRRRRHNGGGCSCGCSSCSSCSSCSGSCCDHH